MLGSAPLVTYFEESFLVRRGRATLRAVLNGRALGGFRTRTTGATSLEELVAAHGGRVDVVAFMLLGEVRRLESYSSGAAPMLSATDAWEGVAPEEIER